MARKRAATTTPADAEAPDQVAVEAQGAAPTEAAATAPAVKKSGPAHEIRFGRIKAVIWKNNSADHGPWYSVTVGRVYKDEKSGTFKTAGSFGRDDLLVAAKALEEAWFWVNAQGNSANAQTQQQPANGNATASTSDEPIPF